VLVCDTPGPFHVEREAKYAIPVFSGAGRNLLSWSDVLIGR
jgi:hypothetical protein